LSAREWIERGHAATDEFDAFANYWRAFNGMFADYPGEQERHKIKECLSATTDESFASLLLAEQQENVKILLSRPVTDMRKNGRDTAINVATFEGASTALEKLKQVFLIIYQVRCNLEHGKKSPSWQRDSDLVLSSAQVLRAVLRNAA
jgi:hypothetical protein